ncbi:MAG: hypothetical protein NC819_00845 [Candidatus Omnitrophica bacterium]|nr:hypothetical protein [Candidatus Omnitrophota bacterium]
MARSPSRPPKLREERSDNTRTVLEARYLLRDDRQRVMETPQELFRRFTRAVARAAWALQRPRVSLPRHDPAGQPRPMSTGYA